MKKLWRYAANIDPLWAEDILRDRGGSLTPQSLREMILLSTEDQGAADAAYSSRALADLDRSRGGH